MAKYQVVGWNSKAVAPEEMATVSPIFNSFEDAHAEMVRYIEEDGIAEDLYECDLADKDRDCYTTENMIRGYYITEVKNARKTRKPSKASPFARFSRNPVDFEGSIVLFAKELDRFFCFSFGQGDDLDADDIKNGCDDYINYEVYAIGDASRTFDEIAADINYADGYLDGIYGLDKEDSGMMLVKRSNYRNSGDIRDYLENALDMANYGAASVEDLYKDLEEVYVG